MVYVGAYLDYPYDQKRDVIPLKCLTGESINVRITHRVGITKLMAERIGDEVVNLNTNKRLTLVSYTRANEAVLLYIHDFSFDLWIGEIVEIPQCSDCTKEIDCCAGCTGFTPKK